MLSTLRPHPSLWRRTRSVVLAGSIALGTILAPQVVVASLDTGPTDGTAGAGSTFAWEGETLDGATALVSAGSGTLILHAEPSRDGAELDRIPSGTVVALRIDEADSVQDPDGITRWWPVAYGGQDGWVSGMFLVNAGGLPPGASPFEFTGDSLTGATARVRSVGGLRLREEPTTTSTSLATIPNDTVIALRIDEADSVNDPDGITRWWPVTHNGQDGWVSGWFLTGPDGATVESDAGTTTTTTAPATASEPFTWDGETLEGATAIAAGDGQNVNVRDEPSDTADIVAKAPDGSVVALRIDMVDSVAGPDGETRWWPVTVDGVEGWISGNFLVNGTSAAPSVPGNATSDIFPAGSTALVQTQSGSGAKLRAGAGMDAEQVGSVPERAELTVLGGPASHENSQNGWFEVEFGGKTGYVDGDLLVLVATPVAPETPATEPATVAPTEPAETPASTETPEPTATEEPTLAITPVTRATETETPDATATQVDGTSTPEPTEEPTQSGSGFILPVQGAVLTQGFGCSSLGFYPYNPDWGCGVHDGVDYAAPSGTPILAAAGGTVVTAGWCDCGLGYYVEIDHGNNLHTIYGHMASQPYVSVGQQVSQGETIGPVGSTGLSTGPHVHFMVQVNGISQDPSRYLP